MRTKRLTGFTLVELIVVIAIIGVLAAILVPSMLGYMNKAKFSSANSTAKTLLNAGMSACREADVVHLLTDGIYTDEAHKGGSSGAIHDAVYEEFIYQYFESVKGTTWAVKVESDCAVAACFKKNDSDVFLGTYPQANHEKKSGSDLASFILFAETGSWT